MQKRVYITDYDLVSPLGCGKKEVFDSLERNFAAEGNIMRFDTTGIPFSIAAEIRFSLSDLYSDENDQIKTTLGYDRKFELTVSAYNLMKERLQEVFRLADPSRKGVIFGMGADVTPLELIVNELIKNKDSKNRYFDTIIHKNICCIGLNKIFNPYDLCSIYLAEKLELGAFQKTCLTACAASNQAVGFAFKAIQNNDVDIVLAGGSDSILNAIAFTSFFKLGVLSSVSENGKTCKPFDVNRCGTLAGEAAGLCVLAGEDFVKQKNVKPLFEVLSFGNTLDAYQITSPDPEGKGMMRALKEAILNAGISPSEIDYINLHGTGTRLNDQLEIFALKEVLGSELKNIPISSTKDRHGHSIAAAGIQELSVLCLALENNFIPCNMNLEKPFELDSADLVKNKNRYSKLTVGMNCNYSFGGVNTALIIRKIS
jgi:3-oxoacyl-[acyl-carrier-protein] synthase II